MRVRLGLISFDAGQEVFLGRDFAQAKPYSEETANTIDEEVRAIVRECYSKAREIILQHEDILHSCASLLLEKERITREEFEALWPKQPKIETTAI
ncbi:MAG: hypothetical protein LUH19_01320 [Lachnospiraceae bacterium]|nr:hypothetical protein [Lachnospiraceae bacterium]